MVRTIYDITALPRTHCALAGERVQEKAAIGLANPGEHVPIDTLASILENKKREEHQL